MVASTKGIYRTQDDFNQHRLLFEAPASSHKVTIRTHEFMGAPHVTIDSGGQKYYFLKVELFGYRDGKRDFRFFDNQAFQIIDTAGFYIYARTGLENGKGTHISTKYYFSKTGSDYISELTIPNLKAAFSEKTAFCYALDCQFGHNGRLLEYDYQLKCYKVKHLFKNAEAAQ